MKGNNSFEMNQATMVEAVQEYFDKRWTGTKQKIELVTATSVGGSHFDVHVSEVKPTASSPQEEQKIELHCVSTRHSSFRQATRGGGRFALCDECWQLLKDAP